MPHEWSYIYALVDGRLVVGEERGRDDDRVLYLPGEPKAIVRYTRLGTVDKPKVMVESSADGARGNVDGCFLDRDGGQSATISGLLGEWNRRRS